MCWRASSQTDELAQQSRNGKELMAEGRYEEAMAVYQQLVKTLPDNAGLLLNLALAEEMAGHPQKAIPHFQTILKSQPDSIPALSSLAMARLQLNQPGEAIAPLKKLISLQPDNIDAHGMLAGAEMGLNRFEAAAEQYRQLTRLAPSDPKSWYGLGKAYEALGARAFDQLNKAAPESGYVALLLADSRVQQRQYRSAFFFYREAEKKTPQLPGLHSGLARVYRNTGHDDWATVEEEQEKALAAHSGSTAEQAASPNTPKGLFWITKKYNQLALEAFEHLGQLLDSVELHAVKAQVFHDHGQYREAADEWRAALALAPEDPRLKTELVTSLFLAHDYEAAMPILKALLASDPQSADLNFMLGESLWRTQQSEKAVPYLQKALQLNGEMLPAHAALGLTLVSLNRNTEAISHLQKAVSLDDDGSLHYSLARAYKAAGDQERARQSMEEYAHIQKQNREVNDQLAKEAEITAPPRESSKPD